MTVSRHELREQFRDEPRPVTNHPNRAQLATLSQALRNGWPLTDEQWQKGAVAALQIVLDASTAASLKLSAVMLLIEAGRSEMVGVAALKRTLKGVLANAGHREADEAGPGPPDSADSASGAPQNAPT